MTFIRKKEITPRSGRLYDYEVESYREGGKVKQRVIRYIGRSGTTASTGETARIGTTRIKKSSNTVASPVSPHVAVMPTCKNCGSTGTYKFGKYKETQLFMCHSCHKRFIPNDSVFGMRTPTNQVSSAITRYYDDESVSSVCRQFKEEFGYTPSKNTVFNWITKYTNSAKNLTKDLRPKTIGTTWIADETVLKIGGKNVWMYDIIDKDTRFLLATRLSYSRTTNDAKMLMEQAKKVAGITPKEVVTDKQNSYLDGIEQAYGADTEHTLGNPFSSKESGESTSEIERFHGTVKYRTKVMRGLKDFDTARQFLDGFTVHYNFIRPHESLDGKTPAQEAGIEYKFHSWNDIIRLGTPQSKVLVTPPTVSTVSVLTPGKDDVITIQGSNA
jgi:transposase-like protein